MDPYSAPGHLVRRVQQIHTSVFARIVSDAEITTPQFAVLAAVHLAPGSDQVTLAQELGIDRSTITDVLSRLATRGLIERRPHEQDRRRNVLNLTPAGEKVYLEALPEVAEVGRHLLAPLPDDDRDDFLDQLARVAGVSSER